MTQASAFPAAQADVQGLFELQRKTAPQVAASKAAERIAKLKKIEQYLLDDSKMQGLLDAMHQDFSKPEAEVRLTEILVVLQHLRHTRRNLRRWMQPHAVGLPPLLLGVESHIRYEPKGTCLIIAPWNYPFNLAISPLVDAIAAGNTAIIKPSEISAHTSSFIAKMIGDLFTPGEVAVVEGAVEVSTALLNLPFNHIFFTGSPAVGKIVMAAAARHLASVTLELGGKSPAIVDQSADLSKQAYLLAWGKCLNNGQTCIAPDYVLLHKSRKDAFVDAFRNAIDKMYGAEGPGSSPDYARISSSRHFQRLRALYDDAIAKGATELIGGQWRETDRFVPPTLLTDITNDMEIAREEIFGPLLPVVLFDTPQEILQQVNQQPKPLTLYIAAKNKQFTDYILRNTSSGSAVVNDYLLGFSNPEMGFGGVNNSGIGRYMGFEGFKEFSNPKAIVKRKFLDFSIVFPPYSKRVIGLLKILSRWGV